MPGADFRAGSHGLKLASVNDALDAMGFGENALVFEPDDLDPAFYDLKTGLAGEIMQKFVNYRFPAAFVLPADASERVRELAYDHRSHPNIRFFDDVESAEAWIHSLTR